MRYLPRPAGYRCSSCRSFLVYPMLPQHHASRAQALAEALDLLGGEAAGGLDLDAGGAAGADLGGGDLEDAVGVHREADLDLGLAARRGAEIAEDEPAEPAVARREL